MIFCRAVYGIQKTLPVSLRSIFNKETGLKSTSFNIFSSPTILRRVKNSAAWLAAGKRRFKRPHADRTWMNKEAYAHLHDMARRGALAALTLDVCDPYATAQLANTLNEKLPSSAKVDIIYISNIFRFLSGHSDFSNRTIEQADPWQARQNLLQLCKERAVLVIDDKPPLCQRGNLEAQQDWPPYTKCKLGL